MAHYIAGSTYHPGTLMTRNVTGECDHRHRTPEAAQRCIEAFDAAIKRGHGQDAYCDRVVIEVAENGDRTVWDSE